MSGNEVIISKMMPQKFRGADGGNTFMLGRKAFSNKIHESHLVGNIGSNIDFTSCKLNCSKPLPDKSADLRIQRLRLSTIGSGSTRLKNNDDEIRFKSADINFVNRVLRKVRGS